MKADDFDILIVGGGLAGLSLAHALAHLSLRIGMIEAVAPQIRDEVTFDARSVALSLGSQRIFAVLKLWPHLQNHAVPIEYIHVSDRGHFGATRLKAQQHQVPAFGYVVEISQLLRTLETNLHDKKNIERICPATVTAITIPEQGGATQLTITTAQSQKTLTAALVIAADGGNSTIRQLLAIKTERVDYQQQALIANVAIAKPHDNKAYERFTAQGPLALLPLADQRMALVWSFPRQQAEAMKTIPDDEFLRQLQYHFGYRVGRFTQVGKRQLFPLELIKAQEQIRPGVVIVGNAAHSLHPIAGQGFNLSLRDVAALAEMIEKALQRGQALGALTTLQEYAAWRQRDQQCTMLMTQGLIDMFASHFSPLIIARDLGLAVLDIAQPLKRYFTRATMGLSGRLPRLACQRMEHIT